MRVEEGGSVLMRCSVCLCESSCMRCSAADKSGQGLAHGHGARDKLSQLSLVRGV